MHHKYIPCVTVTLYNTKYISLFQICHYYTAETLTDISLLQELECLEWNVSYQNYVLFLLEKNYGFFKEK